MRTRLPRFELLPIAPLRPHEAIDDAGVQEIVRDLERHRLFREAIWVARGSLVILNGHHRWAALKSLGAQRIPAWVFDYLEDDRIQVGRWSPGEPITKAEVIEAGERGRLFPLKTTRHRLLIDLPPRDTPLSALFDGAHKVSPREPASTVSGKGAGARHGRT